MNGKFLHLESPNGEVLTCSPRVLKAVDQVFINAQLGKPFMGWVNLVDHPGESLKAAMNWARGVNKKQTTLCVLGIGGSSLGTRAVYDFLQPDREILFFENVDGHNFQRRMNRLDLKKCHFLAVSKSGETSETLFQLTHVMQILKRKKLPFHRHVSVITEDKPSVLKKLADELKLSWLPVPLNVGGRFSVFSNVGMAPLAWAGVPVKRLLQGAAGITDQRPLIAQAAEFFLSGFNRREGISVFWFYVEDLRTFELWLQQLWAESLGKNRSRSGGEALVATTPLVCTGATDQHSLLQQFNEGPRDKHFLFIRNSESEKSSPLKAFPVKGFDLVEGKSLGTLLGIEASATQAILHRLGIRTARLNMNDHSPESIGALIFFFEMVVAVLGECLDINAFDQPGVEAVKQVTLGTLGDPRYRDQALNNP